MKDPQKTITTRQNSQKALLIEQLNKAPIVQVACEKVGVGRSTYYRWRKASKKFRNATDKALLNGKLLINDMAESQLISGIREQNMTAIIFWLKHHHADYTTRVELSGEVKTAGEKLTPEQEKVIRQALSLAALTQPTNE
ncbi:hypothetical protein HN748_02690 [Candidatus Peregrinibacteria bacterium]|jgi:ACT domain-containing protein|nr:hypothetical protein [Candidatus Peregrinibacteria bacterium]MBT7484217.1 hypothetical protein [Candidatus Peregrinibacteria bacterium]MBT7703116.1 hypothetical protein [Candidatus Peregrinibacteria bacterium]